MVIYMKRMCVIFLFIIALLSGCVSDPATYYFDASNIINQATKIQLVVCENDNPININVEEDTILFFDIDNIRIIETLETEKIDEFACELSSITFHKEIFHLFNSITKKFYHSFSLCISKNNFI